MAAPTSLINRLLFFFANKHPVFNGHSLSIRLPVQSVQRRLVVALSNVVGCVVQAGASGTVGHFVLLLLLLVCEEMRKVPICQLVLRLYLPTFYTNRLEKKCQSVSETHVESE